MARILVVDDEPDVRELFNITLKMAGHETETVKHGLEAVEKLATDTPDLIVLDLMMPHMDGFTFLSHVRTEMPTKPMRVLVATAKVLEDVDQERLGDWPVVGILNKGELDIGAMVTVVSTALAKSALKEGAAAAPAPADKAAAQPALAKPATPPAPAPAPAAPAAPVAPTPPTSSTPSPTYTRPTTGIPTPVPQPTFAPPKPAPVAPAEPASPPAKPATPEPAPVQVQNKEPSSPPAKPSGESASPAAQPKTDSPGEAAEKPVVPPKIAP